MRILFIHRSVGRNLIHEGNLRQQLQTSNIALDDYDNNTGELTFADGSITADAISIPGNNTNPDNLADYFSNWSERLNDYDAVIIKSCYPNSHIENETQLGAIQLQYQTIFEAFHTHHKHLILLTSPPLRPLFTNQQEAKLAGQLSDWLISNMSNELSVLDLHRLLTESRGPHAGMLQHRYRRLLPFDNHPNKRANIELAPKVADFILQVVDVLRG